MIDISKLEADLKKDPPGGFPRGQVLAHIDGPGTNNRIVEEYRKPRFTPIQIIAQAISKLTWTEAEAMGTAVADSIKEGKSVAAAIQEWAKNWEKFND